MDLIKKLLFIFTPTERKKLFLMTGLMAFQALLETVAVTFVVAFIGMLADTSMIQKNKILAYLYKWAGSPDHQKFVFYCGVCLAGLYIFKNVFAALFVYYQNRFMFKKYLQLSQGLFSAYIRQPYPFHLNTNSSELLRNLAGVSTLFHGIILPMLIVITEVFVVLFLIVMLVTLEPLPVLVAMVILGGTTAVFYNIVRAGLKIQGERQQFFSGEIIKWINQGLGGIKETKVLGCENFFIKAYTANVKEATNASEYSQTVGQLPKLFIETIAVIGIVVIICSLLWSGKVMASVLSMAMLFALATLRMMPSVTRIVSNIGVIRFCKPAMDIVYRDLNLISADQKVIPENKDKIEFSQKIELVGLGYQYPGSSTWALQNLNLSIKKGESVALVGASGAGKTTLVDIVLGLLNPTTGKVLVDGIDISKCMQGWQKCLGYIPQTIYLSDDSVRCNVAFGIPEKDIDDDRVWAALKAAQLEDFIKANPKKLDTFVGERGVRLSGGQRQRIGIARALYFNPEVLILDEATAALDHETEKEITKTIESLSGVKTIIVIAHRLTTTKMCKKIYKITDGRLAFEGTHHEVVESL